MIHRKLLMASAIIASVVGTACSDTMAPKNEATSVNQSAVGPVTEFTFIKWFTTYPAMTGNTSLGAGTFAGTITKRIVFDNSVIVQLGAIYQVTDPSGDHSFTAVIEGMENLQTASAVLNGVVTEGWRVGAQVHVTFDVIRPCALATGPSAVGTCFQGTIRVQG
jgi:bacteriorhodopsin